MNRRRIAILLAIVASVAASTIFLADRITDGPFPLLREGVRFFEEREPAMSAYVRRLEKDNQVGRALCYEEEVWIEESRNGPRIELSGQRLTEYLTLCHDAVASMVWRVDGGYLLYMGSDNRSGRQFDIAFIWRDNQIDRPHECSSVADLHDFGKCVVPLDGDWVLDYEWIPTDYQSPREKNVMDVMEDVAREATANPPPKP